MAKRRRLGPAIVTGQDLDQTLTGMAETYQSPPIARVAGDAATQAAAQELADELTRARAEGRLVQDLPLDQIDDTHLTRDRIAVDPTELQALEASIAARGQQMPIEVVDKWATRSGGDVSAQENMPRYGLISGWRRLAAIRSLAEKDPDHVATIRAVLRRPESAADAYLSMVEENELRVGLSYYERAQVAARATDLGVFENSSHAVQSLFSTASKGKRSKINSFIRVYRVLDPVLRFPEAIPERLGLRIAKAVDAGQGRALYAALEGAPGPDAVSEQARIEKVLQINSGSEARNRVLPSSYPGGVDVSRARGALKLSGPGVDEALMRDLHVWLSARQKGRS